MLWKFFLAAIFAMAASACSSVAPTRPTGATDPAAKMQIDGSLVDMTNVKISVNGDKVIDDQVSLLHGDGKFFGTYHGRQVMASCSTVPRRKTAGTRCLVVTDSGQETTLTF